jgi:hypothetical protein
MGYFTTWVKAQTKIERCIGIYLMFAPMGANTVKRATKDVISALKNGYG